MATAKKGAPPRGNRPLEEVSEEREQQAWELRQKKFWSQAHIAEELGVSQQAVSKMLARAGKKLAAEFKNRAEAIKAEQTMMLEAIVDEAKQEWERSKNPIEKTSTKSGIQKLNRFGDVRDLEDEVTTTIEPRLADPRYLAEARGALGEIRKIWGIDAPAKTEVETKHSGAVTINEPARQKATEELATWRQQMIEEIQSARAQSQQVQREIAAHQGEEEAEELETGEPSP